MFDEDMVMVPESEYNEMIDDIDYWHNIAIMLSELLSEHEIEHEVSEEALLAHYRSQGRVH